MERRDVLAGSLYCTTPHPFYTYAGSAMIETIGLAALVGLAVALLWRIRPTGHEGVDDDDWWAIK